MNILRKNIMTIFGEQGELWLASLSDLVNELADFWKLSQIVPVDNMTFNYVAKAIAHGNQPVILKISCDEKSILHEIQALNYFKGNGSVQLIAHHKKYQALLLQQAVPGITLKSLYPSQVGYVMDSYVDTMKKLHSKHLTNQSHYPHIQDWLSAIDTLSDQACPAYLIKKAIALKNQLLATSSNEVFLHGDLHHDNIIKQGDHWLAIDPKGVVGEPEFEIAAFDFMYIHELSDQNNVKKIIEQRANILAQKANLNPQRIMDWIFVRLILMAAWFVEDNGDPSWAIKLAIRIKGISE